MRVACTAPNSKSPLSTGFNNIEIFKQTPIWEPSGTVNEGQISSSTVGSYLVLVDLGSNLERFAKIEIGCSGRVQGQVRVRIDGGPVLDYLVHNFSLGTGECVFWIDPGGVAYRYLTLFVISIAGGISANGKTGTTKRAWQ